MARLADHGRADELVGPEVLLQPLEQAQPLGNVMVSTVAVHSGDLWMIPGEYLTPAGLGIRGPSDNIDVDQGTFLAERLQGGQLAPFQALLDVLTLGAVPAEQNYVRGGVFPPGIRCQRRKGEDRDN